MRKNKLLLLLALLMTAVTGAWAQDAKHLITATYREQTRSLEQPLPYATTIGELYEAVSGQSFSDLISSMSSVGMPLTGITSRNTSVVSIGELNGASTPVTVIADGEATISIKFGSYAHGIFVSATSPLYVSLKDGVKDAKNWTVKVGEGQAQALPIGGLTGDGKETVTLQYTGRLKVKGVKATSDAPAAKTPATVTTAPTATTGDIVAGSETALVSGGAATGGTMMYKVTTENTQPTSTEGFSADVPTAKTLAAGTYYVWYYVKADDSHTDSEISATAIAVTVKAGTPEYYNKLTKINDNFADQTYLLKQLGRGRQAYNSSLTAAQAYALATYQAAIDGKAVYVIMSSQDDGYEIHYAVSTDASATEHTANLYDICNESNPVRMYYVAQ